MNGKKELKKRQKYLLSLTNLARNQKPLRKRIKRRMSPKRKRRLMRKKNNPKKKPNRQLPSRRRRKRSQRPSPLNKLLLPKIPSLMLLRRLSPVNSGLEVLHHLPLIKMPSPILRKLLQLILIQLPSHGTA